MKEKYCLKCAYYALTQHQGRIFHDCSYWRDTGEPGVTLGSAQPLVSCGSARTSDKLCGPEAKHFVKAKKRQKQDEVLDNQ